MTREINLWLDETSEAGAATWVVDRCDGEASETLTAHPERETCRAAALAFGRQEHLPVYEVAAGGAKTRID